LDEAIIVVYLRLKAPRQQYGRYVGGERKLLVGPSEVPDLIRQGECGKGESEPFRTSVRGGPEVAESL